MKKLQLFTICFLSLLAASYTISYACGGWADEVESIFAPEIVGLEDEVYFRDLYASIKVGEINHRNYYNENNTDYWFEFFDKKMDKKDIKLILYKYDIGAINNLIFTLKGKEKAENKNAILKYSDVAKAKSFLYYIGFAKRCEAVNAKQYYWANEGREPSISVAEIEKLITGGISNLQSNPYPQIKQRYAMLLCRLHFSLGLKSKEKSETTNQNAYEYFQKNNTLFTPNSTTFLRAKGYAAGSLKRSGKVSLANLLYAQLHQTSYMKNIAQISFKVQADSIFKQTIAMATKIQDKTTLWKLQGLEINGLKAMKEIYKLNPKAEELNILLVRCVNIQEEDLDFFLSNGNQLYFTTEDNQHHEYDNYSAEQRTEIYQFIKQVAKNENTNNTVAWNLAAGYLAAIQKDHETAELFFIAARKYKTDNKLVKEQIRLLALVNKIESIGTFGEEVPLLQTEITWLNNGSHDPSLRTDVAWAYIKKKLNKLHNNAQLPYLAECTSPFYQDGFYSKMNNLNGLIDFLNKKDKTKWETFITQFYPYSIDNLYYMKSLLFTYQGNYKEAIEMMELCASKKTKTNTTIFTMHTKDCADCDEGEYQGKEISNIEIIKSQKKIWEDIQKGKNLSENYFQLASSYYNISFYGNHRGFYYPTSMVTANPAMEYYYPKENYSSSSLNFLFDNSTALKYFEMASENSTDPEFKARCIFMCAKCEQNNWFNKNKEANSDDFGGGIYFGLLKKNFNQTNYYYEIINECGYFKDYLNKR